MSQAAPIVDVNYDQLTYELLRKEYIEEQVDDKQQRRRSRRPSGPVNRILTDVLGLFFMYAVTFVICDMIQVMVTGKWTRLEWIILGPWNYVTGMPIGHWIADELGWTEGTYSTAVNRCRSKAEEAQAECVVSNLLSPFDYNECIDAAIADEEDCIAKTDEYQECMVPYGGPTAPVINKNNDYLGTAAEYCMDQLMYEIGPR